MEDLIQPPEAGRRCSLKGSGDRGPSRGLRTVAGAASACFICGCQGWSLGCNIVDLLKDRRAEAQLTTLTSIYFLPLLSTPEGWRGPQGVQSEARAQGVSGFGRRFSGPCEGLCGSHSLRCGFSRNESESQSSRPKVEAQAGTDGPCLRSLFGKKRFLCTKPQGLPLSPTNL